MNLLLPVTMGGPSAPNRPFTLRHLGTGQVCCITLRHCFATAEVAMGCRKCLPWVEGNLHFAPGPQLPAPNAALPGSPTPPAPLLRLCARIVEVGDESGEVVSKRWGFSRPLRVQLHLQLAAAVNSCTCCRRGHASVAGATSSGAVHQPHA